MIIFIRVGSYQQNRGLHDEDMFETGRGGVLQHCLYSTKFVHRGRSEER